MEQRYINLLYTPLVSSSIFKVDLLFNVFMLPLFTSSICLFLPQLHCSVFLCSTPFLCYCLYLPFLSSPLTSLLLLSYHPSTFKVIFLYKYLSLVVFGPVDSFISLREAWYAVLFIRINQSPSTTKNCNVLL